MESFYLIIPRSRCTYVRYVIYSFGCICSVFHDKKSSFIRKRKTDNLSIILLFIKLRYLLQHLLIKTACICLYFWIILQILYQIYVSNPYEASCLSFYLIFTPLLHQLPTMRVCYIKFMYQSLNRPQSIEKLKSEITPCQPLGRPLLANERERLSTHCESLASYDL